MFNEIAPPPELDVALHPIWNAVIQDLGGPAQIKQSYLPTISAYCQSVHIHNQATENLKAYGLLIKSNHGPVPNPLLRVQKDASMLMLKYAYALGLTPKREAQDVAPIQREPDGENIHETYLRIIHSQDPVKTSPGTKSGASSKRTGKNTKSTTNGVAKKRTS